MARSRGEIHWFWRFLLIPLFALYLQLFSWIDNDVKVFDFLWHIGSINFVEYIWHFVFLGLCAAGLILVMAASPSRKSLAGLGILLLLSPLVLKYETKLTQAGQIVSAVKFAVIPFAIKATGALWGLMMVRGPKKREWEKAILWIFLIARTAALHFWKDAGSYDYFWYGDAKLFVFAVLVGAAADGAYRGVCLANVLTPLICGVWMIAAKLFSFDNLMIMYAQITLCLVYATVLLCSKPARNMYTGFILTLLGMISYSAAFILLV